MKPGILLLICIFCICVTTLAQNSCQAIPWNQPDKKKTASYLSDNLFYRNTSNQIITNHYLSVDASRRAIGSGSSFMLTEFQERRSTDNNLKKLFIVKKRELMTCRLQWLARLLLIAKGMPYFFNMLKNKPVFKLACQKTVIGSREKDAKKVTGITLVFPIAAR